MRGLHEAAVRLVLVVTRDEPVVRVSGRGDDGRVCSFQTGNGDKLLFLFLLFKFTWIHT